MNCAVEGWLVSLKRSSRHARHFHSETEPLISSRLVGGGPSYARSRLVDHVTCTIEAGRGGDGAVAFLREKFKPQGPPCGGSGGRGGHVYIEATGGRRARRNDLVGIARHVKAPWGKNGQGKGMDGRNGDDVYLSVPIGTIVTRTEDIDLERQPKPEMDWVHYPGHDENNATRPEFIQAQKVLKEHLASERRSIKSRARTTWEISMDHHSSPILIARGGTGGLGNPAFLSSANRSPKYATRGRSGEKVKLELELRHLADVGLVGPPNVGKSTILRGLTKSKARVGDWEFTTLEPNLGVLHQEGTDGSGILIADIPGLLPGAAELGLGLGHDFLRHVARAKCLVFIVDLSKNLGASDGGDEAGAVVQLRETWDEVEKWQKLQRIESTKKKVLILANKADLVKEESGRLILEKLEEVVLELSSRSSYLGGKDIGNVIPLSARDRYNLDVVAARMNSLVERTEEMESTSHR